MSNWCTLRRCRGSRSLLPASEGRRVSEPSKSPEMERWRDGWERFEMVGVVVELDVEAPCLLCPVAQASRWARTSASSLGKPGFNNRVVLVDSASDQPRPTTLLVTNPLFFVLSAYLFPSFSSCAVYSDPPPPHRDIVTATRAPSSSEPRINGPGGGRHDHGLRRLSISALLARLSSGALAHSALFFPGSASWLFLARLDTVSPSAPGRGTNVRHGRWGKEKLPRRISLESRAPSTPPARRGSAFS